LTSGICLDFVGQQVDISDTSLLLSTPIFQDSLRAVGQRHSNYTQKKLLLNRQILKLILLITACKPASLQEHKTYSHALWDESDLNRNAWLDRDTDRSEEIVKFPM